VLVSLVSKVNDLLTANQQIGRMGGEEFMLLFPNTNPEEAKQHAEKIRIAINKTNTFYHGSVVKFTVSIGVFGTPDKNQTLEQMVKQADLALYSAKNSGKNQVTLQAVHERD
ncbi:MAG: GGDEF domain-containing protein, partial [Marinicella sp.]